MRVGSRESGKRASGAEGAGEAIQNSKFPTPHTPHPTPYLLATSHQPLLMNYKFCPQKD
ncbi:hypothetical protein [Chroococcidiopsis sp.]|uniref:hypothetical protein n=1 Tax=Chroococcidiopsis sp. TaxID=3088168 RepID=UPI003F2C73A2